MGTLEIAAAHPGRMETTGALAAEVTLPEMLEERPRRPVRERQPKPAEKPKPAEVERPKPEEKPKPAERPIRGEYAPVLRPRAERPAAGLMNSGYISGFFPGAFVTGVGGERQNIGFLRPTSNVRSPGRVYLAREGILAPERVINPSILSPGSRIRGQQVRSTVAATRPRVSFEFEPEAGRDWP